MNFISTLSQNALSCFKRFPLVLIWVTSGSFFLIGLYATDDYDLIGNYEAISLTFVVGVAWLIGTQFISEGLEHNSFSRTVFRGICLTLIGLFYYYLDVLSEDISEIEYSRFFLLLLAGHVLVIFAPFINTWNAQKFWNYLKSLAFSLIRSALYALVLFIGLSVAIAAFDFLFDVKFNSYIYLQNLVFCLGVVNTFIFLNDLLKT